MEVINESLKNVAKAKECLMQLNDPESDHAELIGHAVRLLDQTIEIMSKK